MKGFVDGGISPASEDDALDRPEAVELVCEDPRKGSSRTGGGDDSGDELHGSVHGTNSGVVCGVDNKLERPFVEELLDISAVAVEPDSSGCIPGDCGCLERPGSGPGSRLPCRDELVCDSVQYLFNRGVLPSRTCGTASPCSSQLACPSTSSKSCSFTTMLSSTTESRRPFTLSCEPCPLLLSSLSDRDGFAAAAASNSAWMRE